MFDGKLNFQIYHQRAFYNWYFKEYFKTFTMKVNTANVHCENTKFIDKNIVGQFMIIKKYRCFSTYSLELHLFKKSKF